MAWGVAAATSTSRTGVGGAGQVNMGFVPEIWSGRVLKAIDDKTVMLSKVNRDYEGLIKGKGDTVRVHMVGNVIAKPYVVSGHRNDALSARHDGIVYQTVTGAATTLSIDQADYFAFEVEDIEEAQADPKYVAALSTRAGYALGQAVERYILDKMITAAQNATSDDFGQVGGSSALTNDVVGPIDIATADSFYDTLVDLGVLMDDTLTPDAGRWVVAPSFMKASILKDDRFVAGAAAGQQGMRDNGVIGRIAGFEVITLSRATFQSYTGGNMNSQVPNDTATDDTRTYGAPAMFTNQDTADDLYTGIAGVNDAFTFADQITKTESVRLNEAFANGVRGLHVYGGKAMHPQYLFAVRYQDNVDTSGTTNPEA